MSASNGSAEDTIELCLDEIIQDSPKINEATKNLISMILGSDLSSNTEVFSVTRTEDLLNCGRHILKSLSHINFPDAPAWGVERPQREDQSADERISEISRYKVCLFLVNKCKQPKSASLSKMAGRKFFQYTSCWPRLRDYAISNRGELDSDTLDLFLDQMEESLQGSSPDSELVWSVDFKASLARRQAARLAAVKSRQDASIEELKLAVEEGFNDK